MSAMPADVIHPTCPRPVSAPARLRGAKCAGNTLHIHPTAADEAVLRRYAAAKMWPVATAAGMLLHSILSRVGPKLAPGGAAGQGAGVPEPTSVEVVVRLSPGEYEDLFALAALGAGRPQDEAQALLRQALAGAVVARLGGVVVRGSKRPAETSRGRGHAPA